MKQQTIKHAVNVEGIGLHSGKQVKMHLKPARSNTGIVFRRSDQNLPDIKVDPFIVQAAPLCTLLVKGNNQIATVEHLMAALSALSIDNILIELNAPEIPVMDGSSEPFCFLLKAAGIKKLTVDRKLLTIAKPIRVEDGDSYAMLIPHDGMRFEVSIDFPHPVIQASPQAVSFDLDEELFIKTVSRARTFGFVKDIEKLHQQNRALGASLDNAVGLDANSVVNPEGLRYQDEFARHKLLDAIGDMYVAGAIKGLYQAHKPSHALNNKLLRAVLEN